MFPSEFEKQMRMLLGAEYADFEQAMQQVAPTSIRVNEKITVQLTENAERVKWCQAGFYLKERPLFTLDPLLHGGAYYVQEASSMFLEQIVNQYLTNAQTVLDLCAAPGGKSTLLLQTLSKNTLLISNEIIRSRAHILNENLTKWGNDNVMVTNNKPSDFKDLTAFFDVVVIDAPCSGEGMFRKDANAITEWNMQNVAMCAARQRKIVADVWNSLAPEGILIYSTCTFNRAENEENVQWICDNLCAEILKIHIADFSEITETDGGYRFFPHRTCGEGFFVSVLKKRGKTGNSFKVKTEKIRPIDIQKFPQIVLKENSYLFFAEKNTVKTCHFDFLDTMQFLKKHFNTLKAGLTLGEIKGRDFVPAHEWAMSKLMNTEKINTFEVDYPTAICYLRHEAISLENAPWGYILLTYNHLPLGWVKNLGNRANNLYISEWRIRIK